MIIHLSSFDCAIILLLSYLQSLSTKQAIPEDKGLVELKGKRTEIILSDELHVQVTEAWRPANIHMSTLYQDYTNYCESEKKADRAPPTWQAWDGTRAGSRKKLNLTQTQKRYKKISANAISVNRVLLDGVEFRTVASQTKIKTDNSVILNLYQTIDEEGHVQQETAVGRILLLFAHEMWPSTEAKEGEKPPVAVFAECEWYKNVDTNPNNGLQRVTLDSDAHLCRLVNLSNCLPHSVALWPSDPFDEDCVLFDVIRHHG